MTSSAIELRAYAARAMDIAYEDDEYPLTKAELRAALKKSYTVLYNIANDLIKPVREGIDHA